MTTLLIADDDADFRTALAEQFRMHDFAIVEAGTGRETLDAIERAPADLVLLDVDMPAPDGREVCRILRQRGRDVPVVLISGAAEEAEVILGFSVGANDYVTKPFSFGLLLARIRAHLAAAGRHARTSERRI